LRKPDFPVVTYREARRGDLVFPDGGKADLIHAFTPREHVREVTEDLASQNGCRYLVHLEDNEEVIVADEFRHITYAELRSLPTPLLDVGIKAWRSHPTRAPAFIAAAAGLTAVIDRLLEFKPAHVPGLVVWPGLDEALLGSGETADEARNAFGLSPTDLAIVYTGDIHESNIGEMRSLYLAVRLLRRAGYPAVLLKTGWNHVDMKRMPDLGEGVRDLGFVPRSRVSALLSAADVLVQPGRSNSFNDYRFPSKLPDFLASGKPVVLPRANIGLQLKDGQDALVLERGDAPEIFEKVVRLADDPELGKRLGEHGRTFALRELRWEKAAASIAEFYGSIRASSGNGARTAPADSSMAAVDSVLPAKLIAFYLPQFHPIPENDEWWGEGFTEWTNVVRARPQFKGHHQPQLPADLGFYDLRAPDVLNTQAALARAHGIYGFCFYYYWFDGRRLLERPLDQMLEWGRPDFPFCICWANENWTRRWDGADEEVLVGHSYPEGWAERFINEILPTLLDPRYIRINHAPVLLVYRANLVPDVNRVVERWRDIAAREAGVDLHLAAVQSFGIEDPTVFGFDAAVEFPPHTPHFPADRSQLQDLAPDFEGFIEDYHVVMRNQLALPLPDFPWYRGVMPSWDNTARRGRNAHIIVNSSPHGYEVWLRKLVLQTLWRAQIQEPLIFVNAWNEWAEGTHLEPDQEHGRAWLEATWSALCDGVRQFYFSRGFTVSPAQTVDYLQELLRAR
jgi:glycosyltransferase involved in cell wall biosynthesis